MNQKAKQFLAAGIGMAALIGLDQWTKYLAVEKLMGKEACVIWPGVFELRYLENRGAAFGMLQGKQGFFFLIGIIVLAAAVYFFYRLPYRKRYLPLAPCVGGIAAGAIGNMIDRLSQGYVVDFFYFCLIDFPIFNVADCYVTVGAFALAVLVMFYYQDEDFSVFSFKKGGDRE